MGIGLKLIGSVVSGAARTATGAGVIAPAKVFGRLQSLRPASTYSKLFGLGSARAATIAASRHQLQAKKCYSTEPKGDQQLAEFLAEEISTEKKVQKMASPPTTVGKFAITVDGARVIFKAAHKDEMVKVELNVNHSVETAMPETSAKSESNAPPEMLAKPNFDVEIKKDSTTITFSCSFASQDFAEQQPEEEGFADLFTIDEVCIFDNEWREETYAVSGDILDEYLYDLLMNMLEERGVSNEFIEKMQEFCTGYEHSLYIKFLESLKKFAGSA